MDIRIHEYSTNFVVRVYANHLVLKVQNHSKTLFCVKTQKIFSKLPYKNVFRFQQIWTQHQKLEIGSTNLPPDLGILDFSKFGLSIKSWKLVPPTSHRTWEFWILANLDSASKVGNWFHQPLPPSHQTWEFGILANLDLVNFFGIGKCANHFEPRSEAPRFFLCYLIIRTKIICFLSSLLFTAIFEFAIFTLATYLLSDFKQQQMMRHRDIVFQFVYIIVRLEHNLFTRQTLQVCFSHRQQQNPRQKRQQYRTDFRNNF